MHSNSTQGTMQSRECLICGSPTRSTHHGIDACRACSLFYRRSKEAKRKFVCRTGTNSCDLRREGSTCKKCRYAKFMDILKLGSAPQDPNGARSASPNEERMEVTVGGMAHPSVIKRVSSQVLLCEASTSNVSSASSPSSVSTMSPTLIQPHNAPISIPRPSCACVQQRSTLERLKSSYSTMCLIRRTSELSARSLSTGFCHPATLASGALPMIPADYAVINQGNRILITSLFEFASSAFEGFGKLSIPDRWFIIRAFLYNFMVLESVYRANLYFPDNHKICFSGYTSYMDLDSLDGILAGAPNVEKKSEAIDFLTNTLASGLVILRPEMKRLSLTEEEFLAAVALLFWNLTNSLASDDLVAMGENCRESILKDLHSYYKTCGKADYAVRIGGIYNLIMTVQSLSKRVPEIYEIFRILEVFNDETFDYKLYKTT